jgi:glycosyltransferase involved in cell wall biosynthesis
MMIAAPMGVCLLNNLFPPIPSGSSQFTYQLAQRLAARGHQVCVITARVKLDWPEVEEGANGVVVYRLPCVQLPQLAIAHNFRWFSYTYTPANIRRIMNIVQERGVEVLHLNGQIFDLALSAVSVKRRLQLPLVLTLHTPVQHPQPVFGGLLSFADRQFIRRLVIRHCDEIVAPDKICEEYIARRYERMDSHLIPYGFDFPVEVEDPDDAWIAKLGLGSRPVIASVGHVHDIRDRCDLIRAMPAVLRDHPDALLLIIGEIYTQRPVRLVEQLGLQRSVAFTGPLPRDVALGIVTLADIEAHWGTLGGLGIASQEAMALGKPVMSAARPDLLGENRLENWKHLVIIPRGDAAAIAEAVLKLLGDEDLRQRIGRNAQAYVRQHLSWDAVCQQMESIYSLAISRNPDSDDRQSEN